MLIITIILIIIIFIIVIVILIIFILINSTSYSNIGTGGSSAKRLAAFGRPWFILYYGGMGLFLHFVLSTLL